MRKYLFLILAVTSIYFLGCKGTEEITAPGDLNKGGIVWGNPIAGNSVYQVDLVQGQNDDVGQVNIQKLGNGGLKVTYLIDGDRDCKVTEIHIDIAKSAGTTPFSIDFHVNSQGSPQFGQFDTKTLGTISGLNTKTVVVNFTLQQLKSALNVTQIPAKIYIAVHGVVSCNEGIASSICPENLTATPVITDFDFPTDYYLKVTFDSPVINGQSILYGWCIDLSRTIWGALNESAKFKCSYDLFTDTCLVENYQNLKKANWIINHRAGIDKMVVQCALWYLLDNINGDDENWMPLYTNIESQYMALVNAADPNFVPSCGDKVLVIVYQNIPDPCAGMNFQVMALEVDAQCAQVSETAMGFNYPPTDGKSSLFPGSHWFRYISLNY